MKTLIPIIGAIALGVVLPAIGRPSMTYTNPPFERYTVILDRMPFGRPPPPPVSTIAAQVPEEIPDPAIEEFMRKHRLAALTRTRQGIGVGFLDISEQPPRSFFLLVGQEINGYKVVDADYAAETATISKDDNTFVLKLDGQVSRQETAGSPSPAERATARRRPIMPSTGANAGEGDESYIERLRQRREAVQRQRQEEAERQRFEVQDQVERLTGEALQRHLREYNMQLIRARGQMGPPLPLELTPDEDRQLVEEGLLPPSDDS